MTRSTEVRSPHRLAPPLFGPAAHPAAMRMARVRATRPARVRAARRRVHAALLAGGAAMLLGAGPRAPLAEESVVDSLLEPALGDLDAMVERRRIRALVPYSRTFYFLDGPQPRGLAYEMLTAFERHLNKTLKTGRVKVRVTSVPVRRDQLIPYLEQGRGDIVVGNLTVTPRRLERVDFCNPVLSNVSEILVTGPGVTAPDSVQGLSGMTVHVRESSSYYASLVRLNRDLERAGRAPVKLRIADERLEDEDLMEMANAGLVPALIVDSHKAALWAEVLPDVSMHPEIAVRERGQIAWAIRHGSPKLKAAVNAFMKEHKEGTLVGNVLLARYLEDNRWVRNPLSESERGRFAAVLEIFKRYADRYGFDHLLIAALGYQESRLDQSRRSPDGAVGVMQILPSTAADRNVAVAGIDQVENNIHAGVKYLRFLADRYFDDPAIDDLNRALFAFAAYNAGPRKVASLRKRAAERNLDPDVWFGNVEMVAARVIGRETVTYVSNIYKYYAAYRLAAERLREKEEAATVDGDARHRPLNPMRAPAAGAQ